MPAKASTKKTKTTGGKTRSLPYAERTARRTAEHLRAGEKALRERFVTQYLIDFNGKQAMWRLKPHLSDSAARTQASEMLRDPFTMELLRSRLDELKEEDLITRKMVIAGLIREANHYGGDATHAGRVSSWGKLARILAMEQPKEDPNKKPSGGVMLVPVAGTMDEWMRLAREQQDKLKSDVRT